MQVKEFLQHLDLKGLKGDEDPDCVGPARVLMHFGSFFVRFIVDYTCTRSPGVRYCSGVTPETPGEVSLRRVLRDQRTIGGTSCRGSRCKSACLQAAGRTPLCVSVYWLTFTPGFDIRLIKGPKFPDLICQSVLDSSKSSTYNRTLLDSAAFLRGPRRHCETPMIHSGPRPLCPCWGTSVRMQVSLFFDG